jgi:hypothetical protein
MFAVLAEKWEDRSAHDCAPLRRGLRGDEVLACWAI